MSTPDENKPAEKASEVKMLVSLKAAEAFSGDTQHAFAGKQGEKDQPADFVSFSFNGEARRVDVNKLIEMVNQPIDESHPELKLAKWNNATPREILIALCMDRILDRTVPQATAYAVLAQIKPDYELDGAFVVKGDTTITNMNQVKATIESFEEKKDGRGRSKDTTPVFALE